MNLEGGCEHIQDIKKVVHAKKRQCDECVTMGGQWVHLRTCQTCGGTRCCDSSPNRHASRHAASVGHPVACSAEPGERWLYCYPEDVLVEY
jgi:hypothetical protein